MSWRAFRIGILALAIAAGPLATLAAAQGNTIFMPLLVYRTGPYAPSGIPIANAGSDYFNLLNERDGGINGVKIVVEECETQYDTKQGVECYERLKGKGPLIVNPYSTGIAYQLVPKAAVDKVVVHSMGYGMTASADGRWFPWVFNFPMTYWSQASAFIKYVGAQEGGMDKLKGKKIVHIFHNSPYGKEANPTLETLSKQLGFDLTLLPVDHPGQEQKATWLQVRRINPDWIYISGWGVMNQVAVKEAAAHGMKMDHVVGNWWTGTEADVVPAGDGAKGYNSLALHPAGANFPVHQDMFKYVYDKNKGTGKRDEVGQVLYNRGLIDGMLLVEAIKTAQAKFGKKPMSGEQVRWGFENLKLTAQHLKEIGFEGLVSPISVSCQDHSGVHRARIQQWDGAKWSFTSDWIEADYKYMRPKIEQSAIEYGKQKNLPTRDCSKES